MFNNLNPTWATIIFLEGYKFGVPFYIEVGVFDFDAKQAGTSERELQLNDAVTNLDSSTSDNGIDTFNFGADMNV